MAEAFRSEATIDASPETVWAVMTDWSRAGDWMEGIDWVTAKSPVKVGAKLTFRVRDKDRPAKLTTVDAPHTLTITSIEGPVRTDYTYTLSTADDGCRVELVADCEATGFIRLLGWALRRGMAQADRRQPEGLKALIESGGL